MSNAKLKSPTAKPAKAAAAAGRTTTARAPSPSSRTAPAGILLQDKSTRKSPPKRPHPVAAPAFHRVRISERLLSALGPMSEVNITDARAQMPKLIRSSVSGRVYLIGNAKSADSPPAVLIGMAELERVVREAAQPAPGRTLGEVLASLPFSGMKLKPLRAQPLPDDGLPVAHLPR